MLVKTNDVELIKALDDAIFIGESYSLETIKNMNNDSNAFYCIHNDNTLVGFIIISISYDDIEIIKIGILDKFKKQNLAYESMVELLSTLEFDNCFLEVAKDNLPAIKLYERLSFKIINIREKYYWNTIDALVMQLSKKIS
ncbi:MAG: GNAT family N-acetyltransferase [Mycoplasma sp.]